MPWTKWKHAFCKEKKKDVFLAHKCRLLPLPGVPGMENDIHLGKTRVNEMTLSCQRLNCPVIKEYVIQA